MGSDVLQPLVASKAEQPLALAPWLLPAQAGLQWGCSCVTHVFLPKEPPELGAAPKDMWEMPSPCHLENGGEGGR